MMTTTTRLFIFFALLLQASLLTSTAFARKKELSQMRKVVRGFSAIDTNYIEPQHYNFTVMLQATFNYDMYRLKSRSGQSVIFAPDVPLKVGPYVGWRWFFLGYTFDLKNLSFGDKQKREIDFSIYSSQIGVDIFYRQTGSDYKLRQVDLGGDIGKQRLENQPFDGINVGIVGANLYYIFNHKRFSYPAAFSQSTCQKLSCGSWMAGIGYTKHSIELDHDKLKSVVEQNLPNTTVTLDSGLMFRRVEYTDISAACGYAYNWVFARNCLLCASGLVALSYKHTMGDNDTDLKHGFKLDNMNIDAIGRFGVVYNNTKWYTGLSAIMHSYNYRKSRFAANTVFGSVNLYIGYNFGLKKKYKRKKT